MVKLLVFAILLAASPATGLLEALFRAENSCYAGCQSNYGAKEVHMDACSKGCDFKLLNENCATQCLKVLTDAELQNSCQVGCTLSSPAVAEVKPEKPFLVVDPVPKMKDSGIRQSVNPEPERPRSIILIRLRQRPSLVMPSMPMPSVEQLNNDPLQFFNNIFRQFQEKANHFEQSVRQSIEQNSQDLSKFPQGGAISELVKNIPIVRFPGNIRADSSSESSEETNNKRPLIDELKHILKHPREHQQYLEGRAQPINTRVQQFFTDVRSEWNDLVRKQPKIPIWIFLGILLSSSAILWYMVMSLCRHTPSRDVLSIRAQELIFHPYEHDVYEKEKIQPDDQPYEVTESLPIKVKLSNI